MIIENPIETDRLIIRPVRLADVDELYTGIFSDDELMATGIYLGRVLSYEETQQFVEKMCRNCCHFEYILYKINLYCRQ